jgi:hypothetical protein
MVAPFCLFFLEKEWSFFFFFPSSSSSSSIFIYFYLFLFLFLMCLHFAKTNQQAHVSIRQQPGKDVLIVIRKLQINVL